MFEQLETKKTRLRDICDEVEKSGVMTDAQKAEMATLEREISVLKARINAEKNELQREEKPVNNAEQFGKFLREACTGKCSREVTLHREALMTGDVEPLVPLTILDIVAPLEKGIIYDKVGIKVMSGLQGSYLWPVAGAGVEAAVADEAVELSDTEITFSQLKPHPQRVGITIELTSQAINKSAGAVMAYVKEQLPMSFARLINRQMFKPGAAAEAPNFVGPWGNLNASTTENVLECKSDVPTLAELLALKGKVLASGVDGKNFCFVMSETLKAKLEGTPNKAGGGRMIIENGTISGYPVYCTEYANDAAMGELVYGGCFDNLPFGQFGEARMIVDPYTSAKKDAVRLTMNMDMSMSVLRKEAFWVLKPAASAGA